MSFSSSFDLRVPGNSNNHMPIDWYVVAQGTPRSKKQQHRPPELKISIFQGTWIENFQFSRCLNWNFPVFEVPELKISGFQGTWNGNSDFLRHLNWKLMFLNWKSVFSKCLSRKFCFLWSLNWTHLLLKSWVYTGHHCPCSLLDEGHGKDHLTIGTPGGPLIMLSVEERRFAKVRYLEQAVPHFIALLFWTR